MIRFFYFIIRMKLSERDSQTCLAINRFCTENKISFCGLIIFLFFVDKSFSSILVNSPGAVDCLNWLSRFDRLDSYRFAVSRFVLRHHHHEHQILIVRIIVHKKEGKHHVWTHNRIRGLKYILIPNIANFNLYFLKLNIKNFKGRFLNIFLT